MVIAVLRSVSNVFQSGLQIDDNVNVFRYLPSLYRFYRRTPGLSSVEFGLVAALGQRPPMSVARLAEAVGMDKGQISRALAGLVSRRLVARSSNPLDNREVLVCLTRTGL